MDLKWDDEEWFVLKEIQTFFDIKMHPPHPVISKAVFLKNGENPRQNSSSNSFGYPDPEIYFRETPLSMSLEKFLTHFFLIIIWTTWKAVV